MWQLAKNTQDQFYTRAATNGHLEQTFSVHFEKPFSTLPFHHESSLSFVIVVQGDFKQWRKSSLLVKLRN